MVYVNAFVPFLEHYNFVLLQIAHIDTLAFGFHIRMLLDHQPAHVSEEKAPARTKKTMIPRLR